MAPSSSSNGTGPERNRTLDYKEALARLDQARLHLDEARDYYLDRMGRSNWSVFWLCSACFTFGASVAVLGLFAFGARLP